MSEAAEHFAKEVNRRGLWSLQLNDHYTMDRGTGQFGPDNAWTSTGRNVNGWKDDKWNTLVLQPFLMSEDKEVPKPKEDHGLLDRLVGKTRTTKKNVLVPWREEDVLPDQDSGGHVTYVDIPYKAGDRITGGANVELSTGPMRAPRGTKPTWERVEIMVPEDMGSNFVPYIEETGRKGNFNDFVLNLTERYGRDKDPYKVAETVVDGDGEFGPGGVDVKDADAIARRYADEPRYADPPMEWVGPDETYPEAVGRDRLDTFQERNGI